MRPIFFVICFSLGVSLMIFSGYVPQSASARGNQGRATRVEQDSSRYGAPRRHPSLDVPLPRDPYAPAVTDDDPAPDPMDDEPDVPVAVAEPSDPVDPADTTTVATEPDVTADDTPNAFETDPLDNTTSTAEPDLPPIDEAAPPHADAGTPRVVWAGWDDLPLDGASSTGFDLKYRWRQVAGPRSLAIADADAMKTTAAGLTAAELQWYDQTYRFELLVTDPYGRTATDTVAYTVRSAPRLRMQPRAERRFEVRDGYLLPHYEAWITNLDSYESTFEIRSNAELVFTQVAGGAFDLAGGAAGDGYIYRITVFMGEGESSSWLEFLVDSAEKIPGVLQLGVTWE
jgi:hypothetical protein